MSLSYDLDIDLSLVGAFLGSVLQELIENYLAKQEPFKEGLASVSPLKPDELDIEPTTKGMS